MVGDRYKWSAPGIPSDWFIWEVVKVHGPNDYNARIVDNGPLGTGKHYGRHTRHWGVSGGHDTYLGNFSKGENFNSLYEKLNGR